MIDFVHNTIPEFIRVLGLITFALILVRYYIVVRGVQSTYKRLQNVQGGIKSGEGIPSQIVESVRQGFSSSAFLQSSYTSYQRNLFIVPSIVNAEAEVRNVGSARSAKTYFTLQSVYQFLPWPFGLFNQNVISFIPSCLTSLGIIGTFVGIYIGLPDNPDLTNARAFDQLIPTMKHAFTASLWGIFLGLVISSFERAFNHRTEKLLRRLTAKIDELFLLGWADDYFGARSFEIQRSMHSLLDDHKGLLAGLANDIAGKFAEQISSGVINVSGVGEHVKVGVTRGLEQLQLSLENFSQCQEIFVQNSKAIQELQKSTTENIQAVSDKALQTSQSISEAAGKLNGSTSALLEVSQHLKTVAEETQTLNQKQLDSVQQILERIDSIRTTFADMVKEHATLNSENAKVLSEIKTTTDDLTKHVTNYHSELTKSLTNNLENFDKYLGQGVLKLGQTAQDISQIGDTFAQTLQNTKSVYDAINKALSDDKRAS